MNNSPQARTPDIQREFRTGIREERSTSERRLEKEENVICCLWQHWHEAIHRPLIAGSVCRSDFFTNDMHKQFVRELILADGDTTRVEAGLKATVFWNLSATKRLVSICKNFPVCVESAIKCVYELKGGAL